MTQNHDFLIEMTLKLDHLHRPATEADIPKRLCQQPVSARRMVNNEWATIRLQTSAVRGERILAIGNPAIDDTTLNLGGASAGIVSNPEVSTFGQEELIADITVASGSSGGPLFSLENGNLVGVVLAVTQPGIAVEGVSSSGSYCLAAPAGMLGKWLGLQY